MAHTDKNAGGGKAAIRAVYACIFIIMLLFSFLSPLMADDFSYCFSWADSSRIKGIGQIFSSMAVHRLNTNGRVFTHGIVQAVLIMPKAVFNILNALNALLLCVLFGRHFGEDRKRRALLLVCGAFMLWCFMPVFGQVFLWLDGSVNYSWGMSVFLLFLWQYTAAYLGIERRRSAARDILLLPLAFLAGAYSENGSIAVIFIALCLSLLILRREKRLSWQLIAGLVLACAGFIFLMSAPAMHTRAGEFSLSAVANNVRTIVRSAKEHMLPLYLLYAVCLALCAAAKADRKKIALSAVLVLGGIGSLAAFTFAAYFAERHFCFTVVFTVLACLILLDALTDTGKRLPASIVCAVMAVLFIFDFALGSLDILYTYTASRQREAALRAALDSGAQSIELEVYLPATKYSAAYGLTDLSTNPDDWPNISVAMYYGLDSVTGVYND